MKKDPKVVDVQGLTTKKRRNQVTIQIEPKGCHIQARIDSQRLISLAMNRWFYQKRQFQH